MALVMPLRIATVNACAALGGRLTLLFVLLWQNQNDLFPKLVDYSVLVVAVVGIMVINFRNEHQH